MKKAILFDLDDTLYDYSKAHTKAIDGVYTFLKKEIGIPKKKFVELFNKSKDTIKRDLSGTASSHNRVLYFQKFIEMTHQTVDPNLILKLYEKYWSSFLDAMILGKGVLETLKELKKRKIKIVLVSDLTTHIQLRKIKKLKISKYIDFLVTSEEAGSEKPHSIMYLLALNKVQCLPEEAIMVGDDLVRDVKGPKDIGLDSILISKNRIKKNSRTINSIPEVLKILNDLKLNEDKK
ncbi:HAD family hydrolase [archaeon]|jgi:HAD superfamily hydrolase (TIGR01549 family)|nr:HAD family hydrolase [archaeon]